MYYYVIREKAFMKEVDPKKTSRALVYELWMKAPNPMVTITKTFDVTNLVKISRSKNKKFNMLLDYCIGKATPVFIAYHKNQKVRTGRHGLLRIL